MPFLAGATKGSGARLGSGFTVVPGSRLLGDVFPADFTYVKGLQVDDRGWRAFIAVTGDVRRVLAGYARQASASGIPLGSLSCHTDTDVQAFICSVPSIGTDTRRLYLTFVQAPPRKGSPPIRRLELTYVDPDSRNVDAPSPTQYDDRALAALPRAPRRWPSLPEQGDSFEEPTDQPAMRVVLGSDLIASAGSSSNCGFLGSVALFRVSRDARSVVDAYMGQTADGYLKRGRWTAGSARVKDTYKTNGHTYIATVVTRPDQPTWMLLEHCPTD